MAQPDIFKAQIAKKVRKALGPLVFDITLKKVITGTRGSDLTAGTNPTTGTHTVKGFVDTYRDSQIDGTLIKSTDRKIVILGDSLLSGVEPEPSDTITAEGSELTIVPGGVRRDPAGATYTCQCR